MEAPVVVSTHGGNSSSDGGPPVKGKLPSDSMAAAKFQPKISFAKEETEVYK